MPSHAGLGPSGPRRADPKSPGPDWQTQHWELYTHMVGTVDTGMSEDVPRMKCSGRLLNGKALHPHPGSLKTSASLPRGLSSPAIAWANFSSLGTFPLFSVGLLLRASVSQSKTRLRHAAHRLVNHVSLPRLFACRADCHHMDWEWRRTTCSTPPEGERGGRQHSHPRTTSPIIGKKK